MHATLDIKNFGEFRVKKSKALLTAMILLILACIAFINYLLWFFNRWGQGYPTHPTRDIVIMEGICLILTLVGAVFGYRLFVWPNDLLLFTKTGFTDYRTSSKEVRWAEVYKVEMERIPTQSIAMLLFSKYLPSRNIIRAYQKLTDADIANIPRYSTSIANSPGNPKVTNIQVAGLKIKDTEMFDVFLAHFQQYGSKDTNYLPNLGKPPHHLSLIT